jgi:Ser/Thr protein kinase RdoA (MazF antagonist)
VGVFTQLGAAELTEIASGFELGAVHRFAPIAAGTINSNYEVETDRGRWFVRINEGMA